ncbi:hypothetical protein V6Z11_D10G247400 [Gossypium hirsutum]|uniref:Phorbol-ester/DAG-type domain-containing protein n=1 Tax=Gossypium hirsutum TaxID=3635 RepID=A0A1U8LTN0_GOSHI|nr:uncharacterized protein LOC107930714 [Gossypium hirsutum]
MEVLRHFSHEHPLIFNEERSHESEVYCSACGELVLGPRFSCMECGFHLDKNCAEAPDVMNHPFHRKHNLELKASSPYDDGSPLCGFCNNICWNFLYHCSCNLDFHIKCAFLSYKVLKNDFRDLQHLVPIISSECHSRELEKAQCFACQKSLLDCVYISPDYGFHLHKKCLELPLEINHPCHRHHSLFLQFNNDHLPCQICQETQHEGLVYCCSICKFVLHTGCVSPPPIIEDPSTHEHPFTRCLKNLSFNCDACGTLGNYVSYNCLTCSLMVHKKCITLPRFIKSIWHDHPISHNYFVVDNECTTHDCGFCHEDVNMESGSYYCSKCKFIIHVNCALQDARWYYKIESKDKVNAMSAVGALDPSFVVIKTIKIGEEIIDVEIKHFSHQHNLVLSDEVKDRRYCDGCSQLILTSFYGCLDCDFFLHKYCARLPKKKQVISLYHQDPLSLIPHCIFKCALCRFMRSGFAYKCEVYMCNDHICVRCAEIHLPYISQGHKHPIHFYPQLNGLSCNACGGSTDGVSIYGCKTCSFAVHYQCILAPQIAWHEGDKHFLTLRYHEDNDYSEYHYCDICEEKRSPNTWFYHCAICDNSAHLHCVLGDYPFIKRGRTFITKDHQHTLISVQKAHHPKCCKCGEPCFDLALECLEEECKYISHWRCDSNYKILWKDSKNLV